MNFLAKNQHRIMFLIFYSALFAFEFYNKFQFAQDSKFNKTTIDTWELFFFLVYVILVFIINEIIAAIFKNSDFATTFFMIASLVFYFPSLFLICLTLGECGNPFGI